MGADILRVSIFGLGLVGLTTAVVLASKGVKVLGVEMDSYKIGELNSGKPHFHEPKLQSMLKKAMSEKLLTVTNNTDIAVGSSAISFVTVGTPSLYDGKADISYIDLCATEIGKAILHYDKKYHLIVVKSTVPPGTTENLVGRNISKYSKRTIDKEVGLVYNPEFLKEGSAVNDTLFPHILVIGANDSKTRKKMILFYKSLYLENTPTIIDTNISTAEVIKYANNIFLATKVSFINTLSNICSRLPGVDVQDISKAIGLDPRIGSLFLQAGPGYGGSCFPKDLAAFIKFSESLGYDPILFKSTQLANDQQLSVVIDMVLKLLHKDLNRKAIAVLGSAFKKNTDDIRESASIKLIKDLIQRGAVIRVHDPLALDNTKEQFGRSIEYFRDVIQCITNADCAILMTEWEEYKKLSAKVFKKYMRNPNVVDARRVITSKRMKGINFLAIGMGNKPRHISRHQ
jgi:UDPglucose 6-dehydrogenase